jgi:hypothetical protein
MPVPTVTTDPSTQKQALSKRDLVLIPLIAITTSILFVVFLVIWYRSRKQREIDQGAEEGSSGAFQIHASNLSIES